MVVGSARPGRFDAVASNEVNCRLLELCCTISGVCPGEARLDRHDTFDRALYNERDLFGVMLNAIVAVLAGSLFLTPVSSSSKAVSVFGVGSVVPVSWG